MAERWQQWMPFHIDRWKGSAHVQAMRAAARAGYLYLLAEAWQSDDCSLPDDDDELQVLAGLTQEEWKEHGARIRRRFVVIEGRLRNEVLFGEWTDARKVFERRSAGAKRTNSVRSPSGERTQSMRQADTGTGTGTGTGKQGLPRDDEPTVEEIVCAHPAAVTRKLTPLQVTHPHASAVVDVLAAGEERRELLAKVQAIAQVVLTEWPPGEMKFLKRIDVFFREREFNRPIEEWRHGTDRSSGGTGGSGGAAGGGREGRIIDALRRANEADADP